MKSLMIGVVLTLSAVSAWSFPGHDPVYFPAELEAVQTELGDRNLGELKASELIPLARRLDVARQKDAFLLTAGGLSLVWPGAGQMLAGSWAAGAFHTGLHLGVTAASVAWAYSLLPSDLQADRLDYLGADSDTIEAAWRHHNVRDLLPAAGALALGGAVDLAVRVWSAQDARSDARSAVDGGKVAFEPRFSAGHMGFGMRF